MLQEACSILPLFRDNARRVCGPRAVVLEHIRRTLYAESALIQYMRVDHGRPYIGMPQQLLNRPDVRTALQEVRSK